jgi:hypothetical protein
MGLISPTPSSRCPTIMPSKSLLPSQTALSIHNFPSFHEASQGETSVSRRRMSFLKHVNGLWKGTQCSTAAGCVNLSSIQRPCTWLKETVDKRSRTPPGFVPQRVWTNGVHIDPTSSYILTSISYDPDALISSLQRRRDRLAVDHSCRH